MVTMVELLSKERAELLKLLEGQDTQQKKIAAIMPKMQTLLAPEMEKLGFPKGPMGLMMGFAAFKKASTELEGCAVIQKGERVAANVYLSTCAFADVCLLAVSCNLDSNRHAASRDDEWSGQG